MAMWKGCQPRITGTHCWADSTVTEAETLALAGSAESDLRALVEQSLHAAGPD